MFRRLFNAPDAALAPDPLAALATVLSQQRPDERAEKVLEAVAASLPGDVRGYVVTGTALGDYAFEAEYGYGPALLDLKPMHGPWRSAGPRVVANLIAELFTPNDPAFRAQLSELGLREATTALVVPIEGRFASSGSLVLQRHGGTAFTDEELKLAGRWASMLGELLSQLAELRRAKLSLVEFTKAFVQAFEAQDFAQLGHAERVTAYALAVGRAAGLNMQELVDLYFAAMLHDIGKLGSGLDLSIEDLEHPQRGANLVASADLLAAAAEGIKHHHESWDGSGFPSGMRKEAIPRLARVVAVADTFDVLSSERGQALPLREVEKALEARSGKELDPELVALFVNNVLRQGRSTQELGRLQESDLPF